jgi:hypothetical protein
MITWEIPMKTISEANSTWHWSRRRKLHLVQKEWIRIYFHNEKPKIKIPCEITLIRCSPRSLDSDNLQASLKYVRDSVAAGIFPGLRPGEADGKKGMIWKYDQQFSKEQKVIIKFQSLPE